MYDSIDITNNKNLYNFTKLNKLISNKQLLYNSILIYYILYNKINSINSKKTLNTVNLDSNMDKLVINNNIYNTYETNYKELYEIILKKINNLEEKINKKNNNDEFNKIKLDLE